MTPTIPLLIACQASGLDSADIYNAGDGGQAEEMGVIAVSAYSTQSSTADNHLLSDEFVNDYGFTVSLTRLELNFATMKFESSYDDVEDLTIYLQPFDVENNDSDYQQQTLGQIEVPMESSYDSYVLNLTSDPCSVLISGSYYFDDDGQQEENFDVCIADELTVMAPFYYETDGVLTNHWVSPLHHAGKAQIASALYYGGELREYLDYTNERYVDLPSLFSGINFYNEDQLDSVIADNIQNGALMSFETESQ